MFSWPAVCLLLFVLLPLEAAAIWSLLGGYLLLPSSMQVDLPLLPPLDKMSVPAVATVLLCWAKGTSNSSRERSILAALFGVGFVICPLFTSLGNSYELQITNGSIPGFYPLDGLKTAGRNLILLCPFYVGTRFLANDKGRAALLTIIPTAALLYSLPMLFEIRMSPQLHVWVYGYFPHEFIQQMRDGGFRPVVFLQHGLQVALFASLATVAALICARARFRIAQMPANLVAGYLGIVLLLCKTLGATAYTICAAPIVTFLRPRLWTGFSCAVLLFICAYPALRLEGLIPVQRIADAAESVSSKDRSDSFRYRVRNEDELLNKAQQKPLFGWGGWGRNEVRDVTTGKERTVTDGTWIIQFGIFGWFGYISMFGLLACAAFRAHRAIKGDQGSSSVIVGGLSFLLAINALDLLPNSNLTPITFLLAGAITSAPAIAARRSPHKRPRWAATPTAAPSSATPA